ncbi:MAG: CHASE3 domain-containing protein [Steroidobacteraceae bacterium]
MATFSGSFPAFNRRYVLLPMLLAIALVSMGYFVTEARRAQVKEAGVAMLASQDRMRLLVEVPYALVTAETAQRGYLLTENPQYLQPYEKAKADVGRLLSSLQEAYRSIPTESAHADLIVDYAHQKMAEVEATVAAYKAGNKDSVLEFINTNLGARLMDAVRAESSSMRERESDVVKARVADWQYQHRISAYLSGAATALNIILLLVAGAFITRDIERRTGAAVELDRMVALRTEELSELSNYMQRVSEREKARLARELHDELGSLLVAMKMDLAQLARHLDLHSTDIQTRWRRIQAALSAGVDLKRRVIEELRPTLLDNMGLVSALQWQAEQSCMAAGMTLKSEFPPEEPALNIDSAIAVFRVAQEALTNTARHAHASEVHLKMECPQDRLILLIEDNGTGIAAASDQKTGSHGLASMKHRIHSLGGEFRIEALQPQGTRIWLSIPRLPAKEPTQAAA